jgi:hypothetical protein
MTNPTAVLTGVVASAHGNWNRIQDAVAGVFVTDGFILLAEQASPINAPLFERVLGPLPALELLRGRAFSQESEVRWRQIRPGYFSITFLAEGEEQITPDGFVSVPGPWTAIPTVQKLTGTWSPKMNDWIEVSVPGISGRYGAVATPGWTAVVISAVNFDRAGITQMTRYCNVEEFRESD